jgi:glucose/arabinose dehydrogenase
MRGHQNVRILALPIWSRALHGVAVWAALAVSAVAAPADRIGDIKLPPGFSISIYFEVPGARNLAVTPNGKVVLVTNRVHELFAVVDQNGDFKGDTIYTLEKDLNAPTGVAYRDGILYVAEQHRVRRAEFDERRPNRLLLWKPIKTGLPDSGHHGTRELAIGPDDRVYLAIGVPCNICMPEDNHDAILSMKPDGGGEIVYAKGVRNSVGMDFHPVTGELWFTDNGVDTMGDDLPPDELNRAVRPGQHFGYPYYGGGHERTPDFKDRAPPPDVAFPALELQPHAASLGIHFYRGSQFPPEYRHNLFVAQHGSWNRPVPVGYRVVRVTFDAKGNPSHEETFAEGWLRKEGPWGRPNDIVELSDGSLLVSDDMAGVIYRISYSVR